MSKGISNRYEYDESHGYDDGCDCTYCTDERERAIRCKNGVKFSDTAGWFGKPDCDCPYHKRKEREFDEAVAKADDAFAKFARINAIGILLLFLAPFIAIFLIILSES